MNKLIIPITVILILVAGIGVFLFCQKPAFPEPQKKPTISPELIEKVSELHSLIVEKESEGMDVSKAIELDEQSRRAFNAGDFEECSRKLSEAIAFLKGIEQKKEGIEQKKSEKTERGKSTVAIFEKSKNSPFGFHDPKVPDRKVPGKLPAGFDYPSDVYNIGARWARYIGGEGLVWDAVSRENKYKYDWSRTDYMFNEAFKNGLNLIVVINSISSIDQFGVPPRGIMSRVKIPKDMDAYLKFLKTAVERYDGDGIEDAPGSPVVKYWEVENEVDSPSPDFWNDTPENYALLLKESYKVIKKANSDAKVLIAGIMSHMPGPIKQRSYDFYFSILRELDRIKDSPQDKYFDIFSFHLYTFDDNLDVVKELNSHIAVIKDKLLKYGYDVPFWLTETGAYSGSPIGVGGISSVSRTEIEQASNLLKIYVYSLAHTVKKIFWVTLTEWSGYGGIKNGVWDNVGLINNPATDGAFHKKLSYYTYKKMVEVLEGSDWNNIQTIQGKGKIYIYKFTEQGKSIWVAWNDNSQEKQITISGIASNQIKITEAVPKYESGKDVTDYSAAFNTETKSIQNGKITITLKDKPVFVEEK